MSRAPDRPEPTESALSRRRFLKGVMLPAAAVVAAPALAGLGTVDADAATKKAKRPAALLATPARGPDFSVAKTPGERAALEKQWKQMLETVEAIRKVPVPAGSEMATGALAPRRLRRGEA